jgi:membrane protease YdiL (CAAX protease family)
VRRGLDGWPGATSKTAGLAFAGLLLAIWVCARLRPDGEARRMAWPHAVLAGLAGAALLCAGPLLFHVSDPGPTLPLGWFPAWAGVVAAVAVTEELVLRGTLWQALALGDRDGDGDGDGDGHGNGHRGSDRGGPAPRRAVLALTVTTLAFAALHVPFYGWESVPVNLAAGVVLGGLRLATGTVLAAAVAHTAADLAGWFLL